MTEDEAKTKWCPMARIPWMQGQFPDISGFAINRQAIDEKPKNSDLPDMPKCIGSACMMWRWKDTSFDPNDKLEKAELSLSREESKKFSIINPPPFDIFEAGFVAPYDKGWKPIGLPYIHHQCWRWDAKRDSSNDPPHNEPGYCGLAGNP